MPFNLSVSSLDRRGAETHAWCVLIRDDIQISLRGVPADALARAKPAPLQISLLSRHGSDPFFTSPQFG